MKMFLLCGLAVLIVSCESYLNQLILSRCNLALDLSICHPIWPSQPDLFVCGHQIPQVKSSCLGSNTLPCPLITRPQYTLTVCSLRMMPLGCTVSMTEPCLPKSRSSKY